MQPKETKEVILVGSQLNKSITITEQIGPNGPEAQCNIKQPAINLEGGASLDVTSEVALEAARLYRADKKRVVVTVVDGKGIAIRAA